MTKNDKIQAIIKELRERADYENRECNRDVMGQFNQQRVGRAVAYANAAILIEREFPNLAVQS